MKGKLILEFEENDSEKIIDVKVEKNGGTRRLFFGWCVIEENN